MAINWNIPQTITQGDRITWCEYLANYGIATDVLKVFIVGQHNSYTAIANGNGDGFEFSIPSTITQVLQPGKYKAQFKIFANSGENKTIGSTELTVLPSFENLTELETRSADEIELELITTAIAKIASGAVAEYRVGDRMMRYQDLDQLTRRQEYLTRRIAIANGRVKPGGRNAGVSYHS